ncbi:hypothetical protein C1645_825589 [Glomus cerebriforme]|uniref:Uncharacterized protein n=1 Tax=Glomus cerebriforme TaxID=658196 RepID=A0A397SY54_9GLOM|nr:hypothetical protein C1645_825589 [Glomus cerebriforme]
MNIYNIYGINLYPTYHIAVSPNGKQVATFNADTFELNIYQVNSLSKTHQIKCEAFNDIDTSTKLIWSLAISNSFDIKQMDNEDTCFETLIALSYFKDIRIEKKVNFGDEEKAIKAKNATTLIISTRHKTRILTAIDDLGGLVRFLDDDSLQSHSVTILVVYVNGIAKASLDINLIGWKRLRLID